MRRVTLFINGTSKNGKASHSGGVRGRRMTFCPPPISLAHWGYSLVGYCDMSRRVKANVVNNPSHTLVVNDDNKVKYHYDDYN